MRSGCLSLINDHSTNPVSNCGGNDGVASCAPSTRFVLPAVRHDDGDHDEPDEYHQGRERIVDFAV